MRIKEEMEIKEEIGRERERKEEAGTEEKTKQGKKRELVKAAESFRHRPLRRHYASKMYPPSSFNFLAGRT